MGITHPLEGLKGTKRHRKGRLELSAGAETPLSPYSQTSALLVLRPLYLTRSWIIGSHGPPALGFRKELHYLLPWASELQRQIMGLLSLQNCTHQSLRISLFPCFNIHLAGSVSL